MPKRGKLALAACEPCRRKKVRVSLNNIQYLGLALPKQRQTDAAYVVRWCKAGVWCLQRQELPMHLLIAARPHPDRRIEV